MRAAVRRSTFSRFETFHTRVKARVMISCRRAMISDSFQK